MSPACGLGPLLGEQPPGELADLGHGTVPGLGGGQPAAGPVPRRHHRDEGQVDRRPRAAVRAAPGRPGAGSRPTGGCGRGGKPAFAQPALELGHVLAAPTRSATGHSRAGHAVRYLDALALDDGGYRIWYEARLADERHELRTERIPG